nr:uncharacterized protein CFP56_60381 [Quercus suber]
MNCVDLGYGFFLIHFYAKEDLDFVLHRGLWFIGDHFLSLRPWEPFFKPSTTNVDSVAVWVRLNELPIELYERDVLRQIGEAVGKVLRIDTHTAMEARGKYVRLCVQVDTSKPLTNTIAMGRFEQLVMYEGIHSLCFSCGRVGHQKDACPFIVRKGEEVLVPADSIEEGLEKNSRSVHDSVCTDTSSKVTKDSGTKEEGLYGPWMVVSRKRNGYKTTNKGTNPEVIPEHLSSSQPTLKPRWATNLKGEVIEVPKITKWRLPTDGLLSKDGTESQSWVRPVEGDGGEDRMEAEDGSGASPSC